MYGFSAEGQWSLRPDGAFTRSCGYAEQSFYWDSVHNGTADVLENLIIDVRPDIPVRNVFNPQNVTRAWTQVKRIYPLLGAQPEEQDGHIKFVVFEKDLDTIRPDELVFKQIFSEEQASNMLMELANTKRTLATCHLARVHILTRSDNPNRIHIILQVAHSVSDGVAQASVGAAFLNLLAKERPITQRLEDRLALSLASNVLWPKYPKNSPRQRWRSAIAAIMIQRSRPLYGGHTLPRKVTTATPHSTVISCRRATEFSPELSAKIIAGCKKIGTTFGNVYPVIGQIAATRLLFRHYMRGEISEEEWEFRKREPMLTAGPLNARPMMNKKWYEDGGKNHVCAVLGFFHLVLPFMPLGELANSKPSAQMETPPFSSFMSRKRFLLRSQMVRKQFQGFLKHPLFFEKGEIPFPARIQRIRAGALKWREEQEKPEELKTRGEEVSPMESSRTGPVWTHSGSSFGATDGLYAKSFPLSLEPGEEPVLRLERKEVQLHCRPEELYLGSAFSRGKLYMYLFWDGNVYDEDIVREFLEEVRAAAEWYLANGEQEPDRAKL